VKRYLLDTNVVSEVRRTRPHGGVVAWMKSLAEDQVFLSAVTAGEIQAGVELCRRQDPVKATEIESWLEQLTTSLQVLPMDTRCFREWARLMEGKPDAVSEDAMIAATARVHALTVATRNEKDFKPLGVEIINPFRAHP
jgi:hypothetical protein